jgi:succinate dehydrogenase/fumarate reductase flavoprotein subunit
LINMLTVARLTAMSALAREESRGVHYRSDFPEARDEFLSHTVISPTSDEDHEVAFHVERSSINANSSVPNS